MRDEDKWVVRQSTGSSGGGTMLVIVPKGTPGAVLYEEAVQRMHAQFEETEIGPDGKLRWKYR